MRRCHVHLIAPALALACLSACIAPRRHVGHAPEGARRVRTPEVIAARKARGPQQFEDKRRVEEYARSLEREKRIEAEGGTVVVGVVDSNVYHRPRCAILHAAPQEDRVTFVSVFDGLDAGYGPCTECEPGP